MVQPWHIFRRHAGHGAEHGGQDHADGGHDLMALLDRVGCFQLEPWRNHGKTIKKRWLRESWRRAGEWDKLKNNWSKIDGISIYIYIHIIYIYSIVISIPRFQILHAICIYSTWYFPDVQLFSIGHITGHYLRVLNQCPLKSHDFPHGFSRPAKTSARKRRRR